MFTRETIDDGFTLTTERLALRWPRLADAAAIECLAGSKTVAENTALIPHPYPPGAADQFVFASRLANARGDGLTLAITEKKRPRELIGVVALQPPDFPVAVIARTRSWAIGSALGSGVAATPLRQWTP